MCLNADKKTEALYEERANMASGMMNDMPNSLRPASGRI